MKISLIAPVIIGSLMAMFSCSTALEASPREDRDKQTILYSQDFEDGVPEDWMLGDGWSATAGDDGNHLMGQGHSFAWLPKVGQIDAVMRFRIKLTPDGIIHANVRQEERSGIRYFIGIDMNGITLNKQGIGGQFQNDLARGRGLGTGWHTVEISFIDDTITVLMDGIEVLHYTDPDPVLGLQTSFECLTENSVFIDDVEIIGIKDENEPVWVRTGGPLGGIGYDVRIHPENPDIVYVSDAEAGIFISRNGGLDWEPTNRGITTRGGSSGDIIPIFCISIDLNNPDILWAGTIGTTGIFKSTDGGMNWSKMVNGIIEKTLTFRGFSAHPRNSDIVYAAGEVPSREWAGETRDRSGFDMTMGVVYKTTDGGRNWNRIWLGNNLARYICINPDDPEILYVSTGIFDREAANSDYTKNIPGGVGIIKSIDGGKTWFESNNGLDNLYVGSLFMHPDDPEVLMAGTGSGLFYEDSGVFLSTNGGEDWERTLDSIVIASVEFSLSDPDIAYAGSFQDIYRSDDGGWTWRRLTSPTTYYWGPPGVAVGTPIDFQIDPRNSDRIFVNAYGGGNFISEDGGETWESASKGYTGAQVRDIDVYPGSESRVIAAARSGIFTSDNYGEDWTGRATERFKLLDWHTVSVHPGNPNIVLSEITGEWLLVRSTDGGHHWQEVDSLPENVAWGVIEFAPSDPEVVYAGTTATLSGGHFYTGYPAAGIRKSTDSGLNWVDVNDYQTGELSVLSIAVHPSDPEKVFFGSDGQGLWISEEGGTNWSRIDTSTFGEVRVTYIGFHPLDTNVMYAGIERSGLRISHDCGRTWETSGYGMSPEATISDMAFDPNSEEIIYAADFSGGVFRSTDGGERWHPINEGLTMRAVNALALTEEGKRLYAATEGAGVFRLELK